MVQWRMTNLQLALSIGIPSLLVLVGIFLNNARFGGTDSRLDRMQADLSQFYRDLGRLDAEVGNLKNRQRSA